MIAPCISEQSHGRPTIEIGDTGRRSGRSAARLLCVAEIAAAIALLPGCHRPSGTVLGKAPTGPVSNIIAVRAGETPNVVTLQGVLVEKCPAAGCWFYLRDDTGTIRVDTKAAGFVVVAVPLQSRVQVSGKVVSESEEVSIQATGVRY